MTTPGKTSGGRPPEGTFRPSPDVIAQRIGNEVIIVHLRTNRIYDLNRTAARLWDLLSAGSSCEGIQETLLKEFDVDADQLSREIEDIVSSMKEADLVRIQEGS